MDYYYNFQTDYSNWHIIRGNNRSYLIKKTFLNLIGHLNNYGLVKPISEIKNEAITQVDKYLKYKKRGYFWIIHKLPISNKLARYELDPLVSPYVQHKRMLKNVNFIEIAIRLLWRRFRQYAKFVGKFVYSLKTWYLQLSHKPPHGSSYIKLIAEYNSFL